MKIYDLMNSNNDINSNIIDFNNQVKKKSALIFVLADWCGHCQHFKPEVKNYIEYMSNSNNNGIIGLFNDNTLKQANNMPNINGFPSVFSMRNGMKHQDYNGERTKEGLIKFSNNLFNTLPSIGIRKKISCKRKYTDNNTANNTDNNTANNTDNNIITTRKLMKKRRPSMKKRRPSMKKRRPSMKKRSSVKSQKQKKSSRKRRARRRTRRRTRRQTVNNY